MPGSGLDWGGLELTVDRPVGDEITAVGSGPMISNRSPGERRQSGPAGKRQT